MTKKVEIIINEDGSYAIDAIEGFVGQSCDQKTASIIAICGGQEVDKKEKPEYYDGDNFDYLTINNKR